MTKRASVLSYELQQRVFAAGLEAMRAFASEADAEKFINAPLRLRRQMFGQAQARIIGKKSLYAAEANALLEAWVAFYERFFPRELKAAGGAEIVRNTFIPEEQSGFERLLVIVPGVTPNRVYDECAKHFPCWRYSEDLDKSVTLNDRSASNGAYAIWLRARTEADEELQNQSANDVAARSLKGITLLERMVLELRQWSENGKHLDIANITLCSGSRHAGGHVPHAYWDGKTFCVSWRAPSYRFPKLRVREVLC